MIGSRLGPYEIVAPLGAGGMGEVYRAKDSRLGREVAIKVLSVELASDPERVRRFGQEARAASALNHPNILAVFDFGSHDGKPFLVMELLSGRSLREILASGEALPVRRTLDWGSQIARGLAAAHEKRIIHRDLKPENLFLTRDGVVKILDFGLAKLTLGEGAALATATTIPGEATASGVILGTVGYMAPEQVRGESVDARADIFSFGCVLYELLGSRRAFHGETAIETLNAILKQEPPALDQLRAEVPGGVGRVVERCLAKASTDRFQSARDLGFALETLAGSGAGPGVSGPPAARRAPYARVGVGLGVVLGLIAGAGVAWRVAGRAAAPAAVPNFHRITFQRSNIVRARFVPDGQSVVYSASVEGRPSEIFAARIDGRESRPLGLPQSDLCAVSKQGELLILRKLDKDGFWGTLARAALSGGAPRDLAELVHDADWMGDGRPVVKRHVGAGHDALELPLGVRILDDVDSYPRVSPDGTRIAIFLHTKTGPTLATVDGAGHVEWSIPAERGELAWHPSGEIWFSAGGRTGGLFAVRPGGTPRPVLLGPGWSLHDIAADGRLLLEREIQRLGLRFRSRPEAEERELSWLDASEPHGLSGDGASVLFSEIHEGGGERGGVYLRRSDGAPAVRLADGAALALSEDGAWALVRGAESPPRYWLVPSGAGEPRELPLGGETVVSAVALPGPEPSFLVTLGLSPDGGHIELVGPGGRRNLGLAPGFFDDNVAVSPDGRSVAYLSKTGKTNETRICELASGQCRVLARAEGAVSPIQWSGDGRFLFLRDFGIPVHVTRLELATGVRQPWLELGSTESSTLIQIGRVLLTRDGRTYAFGDTEMRDSSLFVVEGLR